MTDPAHITGQIDLYQDYGVIAELQPEGTRGWLLVSDWLADHCSAGDRVRITVQVLPPANE